MILKEESVDPARALLDVAEEKLTKATERLPNLAGRTPDRIIYDLRVL